MVVRPDASGPILVVVPADKTPQAVPVVGRPASRSHRFTLAEKLAAMEARRRKLAEIEAKKAGALTPAAQGVK